ncbi:MAG: hypothetical protein EOP04_02830 [Proteobacteria bacterium]|nr:MAG: hypothetical protein EOP04_02830 [Pseudomonadota bacterium]
MKRLNEKPDIDKSSAETKVRLNIFINDLKSIDSKFLSDMNMKEGDIKLLASGDWIDKIDERLAIECEYFLQEPELYLSLIKKTFQTFKNPLRRPLPDLGFKIDSATLKGINSGKPFEAQDLVEKIRHENVSKGGLYPKLDSVSASHPVYPMMIKLLARAKVYFNLDLQVLYVQTFMVLKYHFVNQSDVIVRALSFAIGMPMAKVIVIESLRKGKGARSNFYRIEADGEIFYRRVLTPVEYVRPALEAIKGKTSALIPPERSPYEPLSAHDLPALHAFSARAIYFPRSDKLEDLIEEGLPVNGRIVFNTDDTSLEDLLEQAKKHDERTRVKIYVNMASIYPISIEKIEDAVEIIESKIDEGPLGKLTREEILKWLGKNGNLCSALAKRYKDILQFQGLSELAITPAGYTLRALS